MFKLKYGFIIAGWMELCWLDGVGWVIPSMIIILLDCLSSAVPLPFFAISKSMCKNMQSRELIVDFPSARRCHREGSTSPTILQRPIKKVLRFSATSQLHIYERQGAKASDTWYSHQDVKMMKVANRLAAMEASARVSSRRSNGSCKNTHSAPSYLQTLPTQLQDWNVC